MIVQYNIVGLSLDPFVGRQRIGSLSTKVSAVFGFCTANAAMKILFTIADRDSPLMEGSLRV
jgi:hypothetical protein